MSFKKEHRQETIIYLALWALLFMAPVMSLYIRTTNSDITFDWSEIFTVWKQYSSFLVVFLIHNHLLAPMLIYKHKKAMYFTLCAAIVIIFQVYQCNHRPHFDKRGPHREMMANGERPPLPPDHREGHFRGPRPDGDHRPEDDHSPNDMFAENDSTFPLNDSVHVAKYDPKNYGPRPFDNHKPDDKHPPLISGQLDVITLIILVLMLGMNLGIKLYIRQRSDYKKMSELEKQNLEQQLEYLKYQINPHFFMNTLNNIHALIDIDPEKAKATILELSKMMRFVLYEGNKKGVPLDREIAFLQNYITLMKLRYTDKVKITVKTLTTLPNKEIPPLIFITFVENAFKHGVSYRQDSFIDVVVNAVDDKLTFTCRNSRIPQEEDKHGGVGLKNVKQRLELIYGTNYTLDIKDEQDSYEVNLTIPL